MSSQFLKKLQTSPTLKYIKQTQSIRRGWSRFSKVQPKLTNDQYISRYRGDWDSIHNIRGLGGLNQIHQFHQNAIRTFRASDFDVFGASLKRRLSTTGKRIFDDLLNQIKNTHSFMTNTQHLFYPQYNLKNWQKAARMMFDLTKQSPSLFKRSALLQQEYIQHYLTSVGEFIIMNRNTKYMKINKDTITTIHNNTPTKREQLKKQLETFKVIEVSTTSMSSWIEAVKYWPASQMFSFKAQKWYPSFSMSRGVFNDYILSPANTPGNGVGTFLWKTYFFNAHSSAFKQEKEQQSLIEAEQDGVVPQTLIKSRAQKRRENPLIIPLLLTTPKKPQIQALKPHTIASNNLLRAGLFNIRSRK